MAVRRKLRGVAAMITEGIAEVDVGDLNRHGDVTVAAAAAQSATVAVATVAATPAAAPRRLATARRAAIGPGRDPAHHTVHRSAIAELLPRLQSKPPHHLLLDESTLDLRPAPDQRRGQRPDHRPRRQHSIRDAAPRVAPPVAQHSIRDAALCEVPPVVNHVRDRHLRAKAIAIATFVLRPSRPRSPPPREGRRVRDRHLRANAR